MAQKGKTQNQALEVFNKELKKSREVERQQLVQLEKDRRVKA